MSSKRGSHFVEVAFLLLLSACQAAPLEEPQQASEEHLFSERNGIGLSEASLGASAVSIDARRSLAVTDEIIVAAFSFEAVMQQLVTQAAVPGVTHLQLFQQLWDTQNPKPGLGLGEHCNDEVDAAGEPSFKGYPYECRSEEGAQAQRNPFTDPNARYNPIGLFNRFDLMPEDGSHCGEYRVVFAKNPFVSGRSLIIFEAVLPNPRRDLGKEGCRQVAEFWSGLSSNNNVLARRDALHKFYFEGLPGFMPVIHFDNYGSATARPTGQVRTNQFMQANWMLREFKLQKTCSGTSCTLRFARATDKVNPFGGLFNPSSTHPKAADFQGIIFPSAVATLAIPDINRFSYSVPDGFNSGQSDAQGVENNYSLQFGTSASTFRNNIQQQLIARGSTLTPANIVARAQAQSCAGCHQLSNGADLGGGLKWPSSLGFTHISEQLTDEGPDGFRFFISPALTNTFLPHRQQVLQNYLGAFACPRHECSAGAAMPSTCSPCAKRLCDVDPFCCTSTWDSICVEEAADLCGLTCQ